MAPCIADVRASTPSPALTIRGLCDTTLVLTFRVGRGGTALAYLEVLGEVADPPAARVALPAPAPSSAAAGRVRPFGGRAIAGVERRCSTIGMADGSGTADAGGNLGPRSEDRGVARSDATRRPRVVPTLVPLHAVAGQVPNRSEDATSRWPGTGAVA